MKNMILGLEKNWGGGKRGPSNVSRLFAFLPAIVNLTSMNAGWACVTNMRKRIKHGQRWREWERESLSNSNLKVSQDHSEFASRGWQSSESWKRNRRKTWNMSILEANNYNYWEIILWYAGLEKIPRRWRIFSSVFIYRRIISQ